MHRIRVGIRRAVNVGEAFTAPSHLDHLGTELRYQLKKFRFSDPAPLNATIAAVANATCWSLALELLEYGHDYGKLDLWGWNAVSWPTGKLYLALTFGSRLAVDVRKAS